MRDLWCQDLFFENCSCNASKNLRYASECQVGFGCEGNFDNLVVQQGLGFSEKF